MDAAHRLSLAAAAADAEAAALALLARADRGGAEDAGRHDAAAGPVPIGHVVERVVLERKSAGAAGADDVLRRLLDDLTEEMRGQFELFRRLRIAAEAMLDGADEAAGKLARADLKAATDAISLIVRTLEKIDALQRQAATARAEAEEAAAIADGEDQAAIRARLERLIAARAEEQALILFDAWRRDSLGGAGCAADGKPPDGTGPDGERPPSERPWNEGPWNEGPGNEGPGNEGPGNERPDGEDGRRIAESAAAIGAGADPEGGADFAPDFAAYFAPRFAPLATPRGAQALISRRAPLRAAAAAPPAFARDDD